MPVSRFTSGFWLLAVSACAAQQTPVESAASATDVQTSSPAVPSAPTFETLTAGVRAELERQRPLSARQLLLPLLGTLNARGMGQQAAALTEQIGAVGSARCDELKQQLGKGTPHLGWWVAQYCARFGAEGPRLTATPEQVSGLKVGADTLAPATAEQRQRLEALIDAAVRNSPWFDEHAARAAELRVSGSHVAKLTKTPVKREARWVQKTPYKVNEVRESSQTKTHMSSENKHYTQYGMMLVPCPQLGPGCTMPVPTAQTTAVPIETTAHRTMTTTSIETVTKYKEEPRVFHYEATEVRGEYEAKWDIQLALVEGHAPLSTTVTGRAQQKDDEHNVTYAPASLAPKKASVMTHDRWFIDRMVALDRELPSLLREHWMALYCAKPSGDEQLARCARGAREFAPEQAVAALSELLRDDAKLLLNTAPSSP